MSDITTSIDWTKPAADVLADLLTPVWQPTNADVTIGTIRDSAGLTPQEYGLVRSTLEGAIATLKADADPVKRMQGIDLQDALAAMLSRGISLSSPDRQATIDLLATFGPWPDAVRDAVKALGGVWVGRWSLEGFDAEPTLVDVQVEQSRRSAIASTADRINAASEARRAAIDDETKTGAEIVAATVGAFG